MNREKVVIISTNQEELNEQISQRRASWQKAVRQMSTPLALVFDWGDTLMRVFPQYRGAMVNWPEVAAVDGAAQALEELQGQYRLFVATNAAASSAGQVKAALARAGLDGHIERVFTMHELDSRKPEASFFANLAEKINAPPHDCVMIGDDLKNDVLAALYAGWRAVWFNPTGQAAPALTPLHDADVDRLPELPGAVLRLDLPRLETCLGWLEESGATFNLLQHVYAVAAAAYQMALWMRSNGTRVNPLLAQRGGLLHDIAKLLPQAENPTRLDHGELGGRLLAELGQPVLAEIARRHLLYSLADPSQAPFTWEQKLVYFADKLVEGSRLVSVQERIDALSRRYQLDMRRLEQTLPALDQLQEDVCRRAGFPPSDLLPRLQKAFNSFEY